MTLVQKLTNKPATVVTVFPALNIHCSSAATFSISVVVYRKDYAHPYSTGWVFWHNAKSLHNFTLSSLSPSYSV